MARYSVAELWGAAQRPIAVPNTALARVPTGPLAVAPKGDALATLVERLPVGPGAMVAGGLGLAALGALGAVVLSSGFVGAVLFGGMLTFGGGIAFLGMRKGKTTPVTATPAVDPHVLAERGRRVQVVLSRGGTFTFERLLGQLHWTERALVETLVAMKDSGAIIEDLDLDSGEWIYRAQYGDNIGAPASMTLADRQEH